MVTIKDVEHIGELARLELSPDEKGLYRGQLEAILDWMKKLNELDTASIVPACHVQNMKNVTREDLPEKFENRMGLLENAPERESDFFKVRKVIE